MEKIGEEYRLIKKLDELSINLFKSGKELAEKEKEYQILKTENIYKLQSLGESATAINNIIRGIPKVAERRMERDIANIKYKSIQEKINIVKLNVKVLNNEISTLN